MTILLKIFWNKVRGPRKKYANTDKTATPNRYHHKRAQTNGFTQAIQLQAI